MASTNGQFWSQTFLKADGSPYVGVRVFHWVDDGGQSTVLDVYQNAQLTAAHNNPVVGDASGRVYFWGNGTYHLVVKTSTADGNITLYDWPGVELQHRTAMVRGEDKGLSLPATTAAARGRLFGTVDGSGDLSGLFVQRTAAAWQQLLTLPTLSQMLEFAKGSNIASSTNVTIPSDGNFFEITGTNAIESFSAFTGYPVIYTRFTGSGLTLTHSAQFQLLGGQNRTTVSNELVCWLHAGSGVWIELWHTSDGLVTEGGTGVSTVPAGAVLAGAVTSPLVNSGTGTANQVLLSGGASAPVWAYGLAYHGPSSVGSGSTRTHEGTVVIAANQNLSGIHFYTNFTLNTGVTVTVPAGSRRLVIVATGTITINGTIAAQGGGAPSPGAQPSANGLSGTDGAGGGGGGVDPTVGGTGGHSLLHGLTVASGGTGTGTNAAATPTGSSLVMPWFFSVSGGASGGSGYVGSAPALSGGAGGASVVLIAPVIILASTATINTSGSNGGGGGGGGSSGGGGGGAGNLYMLCRSFTNNGATITQNGGSGGAPASSGNGAGGNGAAGVRQILIYG